jgi:hypothetical protein
MVTPFWAIFAAKVVLPDPGTPTRSMILFTF